MAMHNDSPLLIEGPKADTPIIDLEAVYGPAAEQAAPAASRWQLPAYAPLAAAIVFSAVLGAFAGAATTSSLLRDTAPPASNPLQASVAQLNSELATLKAGIANAQRSATTQFGKLADRLDRTEKAQSEPTAKLAKIQDSIDRLEHRQQVAAAPASDITGSVVAKEASKPPVAEGWRLRDYYDGRAVVESRNGTLFKVAPGSNVPGLGKVETIKRENGKVVVVTASGTIAGALEQRRPSYYSRW